MGFKDWKTSSGRTKVAAIGMTASAVLSLIIGFAFINDWEQALGMLGGRINSEGILAMYVLLFFVIDMIVALGLFAVARWARSLADCWGLANLIFIILGFMGEVDLTSEFSMKLLTEPLWYLPEAITFISSIAALLAKSDFVPKKG